MDINFAAVNRLHVPVALGSTLLVFLIFARAVWRRKFDDLALLSATVSFALLGNALICGVISGPHDRYGARLALTVLLAAARWFGDDDEMEAEDVSLSA